MTVVCLTVLATVFFADGDTVPDIPVTVTMVAVRAQNEGRSTKHFGPGLENVRRAVGGLDYDSFYRVQSAELPVPYGEEAKIYISPEYTLYITPLAQTEDRRVRLRARITVKSERQGRIIDALNTTLTMAPGTHLNLGGLHLKGGELIVVLTVK